MATKQAESLIKLQIPAGQATPSPPVGPALGQHGVNIRTEPFLLLQSRHPRRFSSSKPRVSRKVPLIPAANL